MAAVATAGFLSLTGTLALTGAAGASTTEGTVQTSSHGCSKATLDGHYIYHYSGHKVSGEHSKPVASAGAEWYDGRGRIKTVSTSSDNGEIGEEFSGTGTYKLNKDCTGTATYHDAGGDTHYRIYVDPSGKKFTFVSVDDGSVIAGDETRVSD
ncbi:hypothetical protein [Streptomyces purpurogeneiscleroticus]|uniref:hypothetical protein n=1 Tax=Streptomyces purpurogeneiscleroticus TaxID=68259 RepID=UPI001CC0BED4|nr:hypothetical protein [Streptomyces purpurogeneiscleroticus]MBZ4018770.1 hypothetical protein [Streptomyces purpurogeneiscleroticus]